MGFKDMMKSFLYENVEDDDDDDDEEEELIPSKPAASSASKTAAKPAAAPQQTPAPSTSATTAAPAAPAASAAGPVAPSSDMPQNLEAYYTPPKVSVPAQNQQGFLDRIDAAGPVEPARKESGSSKTNRTRPVRPAKPQPARQDYSTVISPIFGNLPDDEKDPEALHDAINLPKPADGMDMVEIISPMFGMSPAEPRRNPRRPRFLQEKRVAPVTTADLASGRDKKAAPSKVTARETEEDDLPALLDTDPMGLRVAGQAQSEPKQDQTESIQTASSSSRPAAAPADLSSYLSRGPNARPASKSGRTAAKSKKGGRSK